MSGVKSSFVGHTLYRLCPKMLYTEKYCPHFLGYGNLCLSISTSCMDTKLWLIFFLDTNETASLTTPAMAERSTETRVKTTNKQKKNCLPLEKLLRLFECPVCWKRSEPENFIQCRNGHFGCKACFSRLKTCPLCRIILDPQIQTFHQETLDLIQNELRHVENHWAQICLDGMAKIFQCTGCKFAPTKGPVFQCLTGHTICYRCTTSITWCTPCKRMSNYELGSAPFTIRSLVVQKLLSFASNPCRFTQHGCTAIIQGFSQHEVNCPYSENECILFGCSVQVSLPKLLSHLMEACRMRLFVLGPRDQTSYKGSFYGKLIIYDNPREKMRNAILDRYGIIELGTDKTFLFCFKTIPCYSFFFYICFLGVPEEAKKYSFTLKMKSDKDGPSVERKAPVFSTSMSKFEMMRHPDVITFSWSEFQEVLKINTPDIHFVFLAQVFENESQLSAVDK